MERNSEINSVSDVSSYAELESFFDFSLDLLCIAEVDSSRFLKVNNKWSELLGYSKEEIINRSFMDFIHPDDVDSTVQAMAKLSVQNPVVDFTNRYRRKDGSYRWLQWHSYPRNNLIYAVARDVTDQRIRENRIKAEEKKYRLLFDNMPSGFALHEMIYDKQNTPVDYRFLEVNSTFTELTGFEGKMLEGTLVSQLIPDDYTKWVEIYVPVVQEGKTIKFRYQSDKATRVFDIIAFASEKGKFATILVDMTEQIRSQSRWIESEKMEAIGRLAGGVAHDFNNQLGGIQGYADLLDQELQDPKLKKYAGEILKITENAAELSRSLLNYSRKEPAKKTLLNMETILMEVISLLERTINKKIEIQKNIAAEEPIIRGDASQIQNALLNLGINGSDAMSDGGILRFKIEKILIDELSSYYQVPAGEYLEVSISDTGEGMEQDMVKKIFEPFFTTKEKGRGTGLGLATVYNTVKIHGGDITVYSETGKGTQFNLYFPVAEKESAADESTGGAVPQSRGSGESILIVDDEYSVATVLSVFLTNMGYFPQVFTRPVEALEYYRKNWQKTDLVILDMMMPQMNGQELLNGMRDINPEVKAILSSGFHNTENGKLKSFRGILKKPFRSNELAAVCWKVLHE